MEENKLKKAIKIILNKCLEIKKDEKVLIITDNNKIELAEEFFFKTKNITNKIKLIKTSVPPVNGTEPAENVAEEMIKQDVIIIVTKKSLSHTNARKNATEKGTRIASMPGITKEIIERAIDIDYDLMKKRTNILADILDKGNSVRITSNTGTDIEFSIKERKAHGRKAGIYNEKGYWGNLPEGETFIAPIEGSANGIFATDGPSIEGIKTDETVEIIVKDGIAIDTSYDKLNEQLESIGEKARNIAEFGIGTNDKAIITGCILEDEKVLSTCHIALGNNIGFVFYMNVLV